MSHLSFGLSFSMFDRISEGSYIYFVSIQKMKNFLRPFLVSRRAWKIMAPIKQRALRNIHILVRRSSNMIFNNKHYTQFIILCRSRTGSNYLATHLASHRNIKMYGELFLPNSLARDYRRIRAPVRYLEREVFSSYPADIRAVGFKQMYQWAGNELGGIYNEALEFFSERERRCLETIWLYLKKRERLKVIHLKRRNILRSMVSHKIAMINKKWRLHT